MKPKHVGIILDGNRRFARRLMAKPWQGHEWGAKKVAKFLEWCHEFDIKEATIYAFSIENFDRPKREFNYLMKVFKKGLEEVRKSDNLHKNKIRIRFIGRIDLFPKEVVKEMRLLMKETEKYKDYLVNFAMAYGGRSEIIDGIKMLAADLQSKKVKPSQISEKMFEKYLYMADEPDLIIRTGGEKRTSNFLIWQGNYSEWFFVSKMWPEFEKKDLKKILTQYAQRERRFGR